MKKRIDLLTSSIETWVYRVGRIFSWAFVFLLLFILLQVVLRYLFNHDLTAVSELQWHYYAAAMMISLSYAQREDVHVRVDLFHRRLPLRVQQWLEAVSLLLFLVPLALFIFWHGCQFTAEAFRIGEKSPAPGGLPHRWIIKSFIPIGSGLLVVQSLARGIRLIFEGKPFVAAHPVID